MLLNSSTALKTPLDNKYDFKEIASKWNLLINDTGDFVEFKLSDGSVIRIPTYNKVVSLFPLDERSEVGIGDYKLRISDDGNYLEFTSGSIKIGSIEDLTIDKYATIVGKILLLSGRVANVMHGSKISNLNADIASLNNVEFHDPTFEISDSVTAINSVFSDYNPSEVVKDPTHSIKVNTIRTGSETINPNNIVKIINPDDETDGFISIDNPTSLECYDLLDLTSNPGDSYNIIVSNHHYKTITNITTPRSEIFRTELDYGSSMPLKMWLLYPIKYRKVIGDVVKLGFGIPHDFMMPFDYEYTYSRIVYVRTKQSYNHMTNVWQITCNHINNTFEIYSRNEINLKSDSYLEFLLEVNYTYSNSVTNATIKMMPTSTR